MANTTKLFITLFHRMIFSEKLQRGIGNCICLYSSSEYAGKVTLHAHTPKNRKGYHALWLQWDWTCDLQRLSWKKPVHKVEFSYTLFGVLPEFFFNKEIMKNVLQERL